MASGVLIHFPMAWCKWKTGIDSILITCVRFTPCGWCTGEMCAYNFHFREVWRKQKGKHRTVEPKLSPTSILHLLLTTLPVAMSLLLTPATIPPPLPSLPPPLLPPLPPREGQVSLLWPLSSLGSHSKSQLMLKSYRQVSKSPDLVHRLSFYGLCRCKKMCAFSFWQPNSSLYSPELW